MSDDLGDRMKGYEARETGRVFLPYLPIIARIDGRCFSAFTADMERPWDQQLSACMDAVTRILVEETGALAGYTQSDEITLLWCTERPETQMLFGGKAFKLTSVVASMATAAFARVATPLWPHKFSKGLVTFDCRVWQVPNKTEAANVFLWRELDATKNAVSMAARAVCSHKELHGLSGAQMQELMFQKHGINFNDYPARFKRGQFVLRQTIFKELDAETLAKIPADKRPDGPIERQIVTAVEMPKFSTVENRVEVLFESALRARAAKEG